MRRGLTLFGILALLAAAAAWRARAPGAAREPESAVRAAAPAPAAVALEPGAAPQQLRAEAAAAPLPEPEPASPRLDVLVTFADEPLAGASVGTLPFDESRGFLVDEAAIPSATTGVDGVAHLGGRSAGAYFLLATAASGESGRARIVLPPDPRLVRATVALGAAAIEGTVHDLDGRPFAGARVLARQDQSDLAASLWFATTCDGAGSYHLGGIAGGPGRSIRAVALDLRVGETAPFELAAGETRRIDFGSPAGRARWSGVLRLPSGSPLAGPLRICFATSPAAAIGDAPVDGAGRFDVVLPPGRYVAHLETPNGVALGSADVAGTLVQDLELPRVVLRGRIRYVGTKHPVAKGPEHDVAVALRRSDGAPVTATCLRIDARYAYFGLEPGSYVLKASPWPVAAAAGGVQTIEIGAGTDELELDVAITDP